MIEEIGLSQTAIAIQKYAAELLASWPTIPAEQCQRIAAAINSHESADAALAAA